ncbi:ATP-dependent helicase HrpA [Magnetococcus marinus MC-1]|uniref:ATP-dependent helicase HrpA n=1 Tax=Magnetococcus marinus (strain ATCC BAA-1437 / JCM 17883 / MC-1) TaxID=156889 RepID=A0L8U8_MAGMM|nr:ATP-dependent RNA helicase HrpA [Magnetococcus marinus]ABK44391.1 ATP-dependent helicase HrpA [Magnetococcus marinus MC-1]
MENQEITALLKGWAEDVAHTMIRHRHGLRRALGALQQDHRQGRAIAPHALEKFRQRLTASCDEVAKRRQQLPILRYPEQLPISSKREAIQQAIAQHQIIVLSGETGSGKTTQLPKICLELGLGVHGYIGVTQPRRIAASGIAQFLASDLGTPLGEKVGYKVRFHDQVGEHALVKVLTDGMLLAETQQDRFLSRYEAIIIDEAHERSLNIDFLLGLLKGITVRRPDLKIIISSATLDTDKFAAHFNHAPIISVSGRTYPVAVRYNPLDEKNEPDSDQRMEALLFAVEELFEDLPDGDVLIFLPGEREIKEAAEALRKHHPAHVEIVPLYARLSAKEQQRIFNPGSKRRIILSTNVAETSLTVPRIHGVIDTGLARMSRFSTRTQVQRLPIERISQASANQRKGRCGRLAAGICIRLYSEDDFNQRPLYTDPEVLRTSLAAVILTMKALKLGDPHKFPFIDAPKPTAIREGIRLLKELDGLDDNENLTDIGRQLAHLPLDPRLARMLLAAERFHCLQELLILAAALSTQDPREFPEAEKGGAKQHHARFSEPRSEFIGRLRLWRHIEEMAEQARSKTQLRNALKKQYLSPLRVREWQDITHQLTRTVKELGLKLNEAPGDYAAIHKALLAGLLGNLGMKGEKHQYDGVRGLSFHIFPGSELFGKSPKWVVAAELVETSKLYARLLAQIEPEWVEEVAPHLVKKHPFDPHWEKRAAQTMVYERVTLFGLTLIPKRSVPYAPIAPADARAMFIHNGLVAGDMHSNAPFYQHNRALIEEAEGLEHRTRERGYLADDQALFDFFDGVLPPDINNLQALDQWRRSAERKNPKALFLPREVVFQQRANLDDAQFPGHITLRDHELALIYQFNPGQGNDGVTTVIPLPVLNQFRTADFQWLVPGLLEEKIVGLFKILPKRYRRHLVPLPQTAKWCAAQLPFNQGTLTALLARLIEPKVGEEIPPDAWQWENLPEHLQMNFRIVDDSNRKVLAQGRDLALLQEHYAEDARDRFEALPKVSHEKSGLLNWNFDPLPLRMALMTERNRPITCYPALRDDGGSVGIAMAETQEQAQRMHHAGLRRLLLLQVHQQVKMVQKNPPISNQALAHYTHLERKEVLVKSLLHAAADRVFFENQGVLPEQVRNQADFQKILAQGRAHLIPEVEAMGKLLDETFVQFGLLRNALKKPMYPTQQKVAMDIEAHLDKLLGQGFLRTTPPQWLSHLPRYLKAMLLRLERGRHNSGKDLERQAEYSVWQEKYDRLMEKYQHETHLPAALVLFRWALEEYRVSLFAQDLKTAIPVSHKRMEGYYRDVPPR